MHVDKKILKFLLSVSIDFVEIHSFISLKSKSNKNFTSSCSYHFRKIFSAFCILNKGFTIGRCGIFPFIVNKDKMYVFSSKREYFIWYFTCYIRENEQTIQYFNSNIFPLFLVLFSVFELYENYFSIFD